MYIIILVTIHVLLLWKVYVNPFHMATSELLSTFFPAWIWMGRKIRGGKSWKHDNIYWLNFHAHPVLSSYYPPQIISSWISSFLSLNAAFKFYIFYVYSHLLLQSFLWQIVFFSEFSPIIALYGAITFTYSSYQWRIQPCIIFTMAWFPITLCSSPIISGFGLCMMLLAGYYPFVFILMPIIVIFQLYMYSNLFMLLGVIPALIQLIPFFKYLPKTVRSIKSHDISAGFWETRFYAGISTIILAMFCTSSIWIALVVCLFLRFGLFKRYLPRVHQRWMIAVGFIICWMAMTGLNSLTLPHRALISLIVLQVLDLWLHNRKMLPTRPFTEIWNKPSLAFNNAMTKFLKERIGDYKVSGLPHPLQTGYINELRTLGYCGGMANKMMAKFRKDRNPNGSGEHDWFRSNPEGSELTNYRVGFAYTRKKINWSDTDIKHLKRNPDIS